MSKYGDTQRLAIALFLTEPVHRNQKFTIEDWKRVGDSGRRDWIEHAERVEALLESEDF